MFRTCSFKNREVINIDTAERIGTVRDVEISPETGNISALIVRRHTSLLPAIFGGELSVPWSSIQAIGRDIILVRVVELEKRPLI